MNVNLLFLVAVACVAAAAICFSLAIKAFQVDGNKRNHVGVVLIGLGLVLANVWTPLFLL